MNTCLALICPEKGFWWDFVRNLFVSFWKLFKYGFEDESDGRIETVFYGIRCSEWKGDLPIRKLCWNQAPLRTILSIQGKYFLYFFDLPSFCLHSPFAMTLSPEYHSFIPFFMCILNSLVNDYLISSPAERTFLQTYAPALAGSRKDHGWPLKGLFSPICPIFIHEKIIFLFAFFFKLRALQYFTGNYDDVA